MEMLMMDENRMDINSKSSGGKTQPFMSVLQNRLLKIELNILRYFLCKQMSQMDKDLGNLLEIIRLELIEKDSPHQIPPSAVHNRLCSYCLFICGIKIRQVNTDHSRAILLAVLREFNNETMKRKYQNKTKHDESDKVNSSATSEEKSFHKAKENWQKRDPETLTCNPKIGQYQQSPTIPLSETPDLKKKSKE
ncbi:Hypothetical predicted protein [Paramuricea clavata]|uniref:Uncharacterized protein n=1 Tax=Paramuricea clavata TaxID=317549 RepID=A0A6S7HCM3_PARCT|nr:Hypothetical predicted protein [Paramuricea clavata]